MSFGGADVLQKVRELRAKIEEGAASMESERQVSKELVEALRQCGVFRMYVPRVLGGLELEFPKSLEVITELAAADGSVG